VPAPSCTDEEFIELFQNKGATETARTLNITVRNVLTRRRRIEKRMGISLLTPGSDNEARIANYKSKIDIEVLNGSVVIGSDAHYWPGAPTVAHLGFVKVIKELKPEVVILNGDIFDGHEISRHPKIMWQGGPKLKEEIQAVEERTDEIREASKAKLFWTIGNHDARFETYLSNKAPAIEQIRGSRLSDNFPHWTIAWSVWINDQVVVKHRFKGGIHATHNNTLWAGKTMVTGHLHSLKVTPFSDYNGTRFGVDTGTLSDPYGEHTGYMEYNPRNHRSGFVVLTFHNGELLWPEVAAVVGENRIQFRGKIINV
jgi:predicted phosphodiesterase